MGRKHYNSKMSPLQATVQVKDGFMYYTSSTSTAAVQEQHLPHVATTTPDVGPSVSQSSRGIWGSNTRCVTCDITFSDVLELRSHYHTREHQRKRQGFACSVCGKQFSRAFNLRVHEFQHQARRPFECTVCRKTFCTSTYLKIHTRSHTGERPYVCPCCGMTFSQVSNYNNHVRIVHPNGC